VSILLIACTALIYIAGAQAVHDTGRFQLDGNGSTLLDSTPTATDDWDKVCNEATGGDSRCHTSANSVSGNTTGAKAVSWTADCALPAGGGTPAQFCGDTEQQASTIFAGSSKDPNDIPTWSWKDGAGGLPSKDNLLHAFSVRYSLPGTAAGGTCPNGTDANGGTFDPSVNCDVIYYGLDRWDNSGDAQNGFWFLQSAVNLNGPKSGGGQSFVGSHTTGDVLVVSDFSIGGTVSTITVYSWDPACTKAGQVVGAFTCGDANLKTLLTQSNAKCTSALPGDAACGLVNPSDGTESPWNTNYTDKSGNHSYLKGEFFEAGINLSQLGLAGECFATVVSESRSSTSTTATLKDFVLAPFAPCLANIGTTPSATSVAPQTPVHDTATITGNQSGKVPGVSDGPYTTDGTFPANTVKFYLCGGAGSTITSCETTDATKQSIGTCTPSPTGTLSTVAGTENTNEPKSRCNSDNVNTSASPLPPGHYCFRAEWAGDKNYTDALPRATETETGECFDVTVIPTNIATTQFYYPNDHATVSTGTGNLPAGSVEFKLYGPTTGGNTALQNCQANGSTVGSGGLLYRDPGETINGTSASQTVSTSNTSVRVPDDVTSLYWRVTYTFSSPTPGYAPASSVCVENTQYTVGTGTADDTMTVHNDKVAHP
jgi:hypothetical protein